MPNGPHRNARSGSFCMSPYASPGGGDLFGRRTADVSPADLLEERLEPIVSAET